MMDKKILALIMVMVVFLSGCGKTEPEQEITQEQENQQQQTQEQTEDDNQNQEEQTEQQQTQEPSCDDGIKNADETDIDCGGSCSPCSEGKNCGDNSDCDSGICEDGVCKEEPDEKILTIEIDNLSLSQKYVTIEKGTTVVWINNEDHPHVIAAHYNEFRSPRLEEGDSYNHTFNEVGEYSYICAIFKTQIQGTINVEENP